MLFFLRYLPVSHPQDLVRVAEIHPKDFRTWEVPYTVCRDAAQLDPDFSEVFCQGEAYLPLVTSTGSVRARVHFVSASFFRSLGVAPYLGRVLNRDDEETRAPVAVLSYDSWRRNFDRDRGVIGRKARIGQALVTIIGVTRPEFNGFSMDTDADVRAPLSASHLLEGSLGTGAARVDPAWVELFARLRDGVAFGQASKRVDKRLHAAIEEAVHQRYPKEHSSPIRSKLELESVAHGVSVLRGPFSRGLKLLMVGVALLLLLTCANLAGLMLTRSAARRTEIAIRRALGASQSRIVRQMLTEAMLLGTAGAVLAIALTYGCLPLLLRFLPTLRDRAAVLQPLTLRAGIDARVLGFVLALSIVSVLLFGALPALRPARVDALEALQAGRRATERVGLRSLFVVAQVAICTVLLIAATLLLQTLQRLEIMDPGFDSAHVVTFTVDPALRGYTPEAAQRFSKTLLERAAHLPGVIGAALSSRPLMRGTGLKATFAVSGHHISASDYLNTSMNDVTPGYFATLGIRLIAGRDLTWFDHPGRTPYPVVVNEAFARHFFPDRNPVGERFGIPGPDGVAAASDEIVGLVGDAKYRSLREPVPPTVYSSAANGLESDFLLYVRTRARPEAVIAPVRQLLHSLDRDLPIVEIHVLREEVETSLWQERLLAALSTVFAAFAALLSAIGLYAALDYAVKSRTREVGVRMAVGAQPGRIARLFAREVFVVTSSGIVLGIALYAWAAKGIGTLLYEAQPWQPMLVLSVAVFVLVTAALAVTPAIRRAMRIEPASALRSE